MPASKKEMDEMRKAAAIYKTDPKGLAERADRIYRERCYLPPERLLKQFDI